MIRLHAGLSASPRQGVQSSGASGRAPGNQDVLCQSSWRRNNAAAVNTGLPAIFGPLKRYREVMQGAWDYFRHPEYQHLSSSAFNNQWVRERLFQSIIAEFRHWAIVEIRAHHESITEYFADTGLQVFAVESNSYAFGFSWARFRRRQNVRILLGDCCARLKSLLAGRLWRPSGANSFFYLHAHWDDDLLVSEVIDIIFCHCPSAIVMIDGFEVPGDAGYVFVNYASGKALNADCIEPVVSAHRLAALYPSAPSEIESGAKRGCVVLAAADVHGKRLAAMLMLRR